MYIGDAAIVIVCSAIINVLLTVLLLRLILIKLKLKPIIRMAQQAASMMGTTSQQVQHTAKLKATQKVAKEKAMKGAIQSLPGGSILQTILTKSGLSPEEMFALMQDQDFLKGIKTIIDTFQGAAGFIKEKVTGEKVGAEENQLGGMM